MIEIKIHNVECSVLNEGKMKFAEGDLKQRRYRDSKSLRNSMILRASKSPGLTAQLEYENGEIRRIFCTNLDEPHGSECNLGGKCIYR